MSDKEQRKNEHVREIGMRATYFEIKARLAYGDTLRGGMATRQHLEAAKIAEDLFKYYPNAQRDDMGKVLRIELGRALCKAGQIQKA